jgi:hypothetical protein
MIMNMARGPRAIRQGCEEPEQLAFSLNAIGTPPGSQVHVQEVLRPDRSLHRGGILVCAFGRRTPLAGRATRDG